MKQLLSYTLLIYIAAVLTPASAINITVTPLSTQHLLPVSSVNRIVQDREGYMWYATHGAGLVRDNGYQLDFFRSDHHNPDLLTRNEIICVAEDTVTRELWFGSTIGAYVLNKSDYTVRPLSEHLRDLRVYDMVQSRDGAMWVAAGHSVFHFSAQGELLRQYPLEWHRRQVNAVSLFLDSHDRLWVPQWNGGLQSVDTKTGEQAYHPWEYGACPLHISEDTLRQGLWIGTYGQGVVFYDGQHTTPVVPGTPDGQGYSPFVDYRHGLLWVVSASDITARRLSAPDGPPVFTMPGGYSKLTADRDGNIWAPGTISHGAILTCSHEDSMPARPDTPKSPADDEQPPMMPSREALRGERPTAVCQTADSTVYIGTNSSLFAYDLRNGTNRCIETGLGVVRDIKESPEHRLYLISVKRGICQLTGDDSLRVLTTYRKHRTLACDKAERLWVGDDYGDVWVWSVQSGQFDLVPAASSREGGSILQMKTDSEGHLWVLTSRDLKEYAPQTDNVRQMDADELGLESLDNLAVTDEGVSVSGMGGSRLVPHLRLLDGKAPQTPISVASYTAGGQHVLLPADSRHISIGADTSILELQLTAFNYTHAAQAHFAYRLPGWMNEWVELAEGDNTVRLINLPKGRYRLEVKALDDYGQWSQPAEVLTIDRRPAWWETWWAYALYAVLVLVMVALAVWQSIRRQRQKSEARMQERLTEKKLRFFTNVSHELRTPLSLVITPLESILRSLTSAPSARGIGGEALHARLSGVLRHAHELLDLINRLLDFRKMEVGEMKLHLSGGDLVDFLRVSTESFRPLAEAKGLRLDVELPVGALYTDFDHRMMQHVVYNLLSNAIKYTERGRVTVKVEAPTGTEGGTVMMVSDTGLGIPATELPHIFDRYYQASTATDSTATGTGIGLHMVREMVTMMGGAITVESLVGRGSTFTVTLPVTPQQRDGELPRQPVIPKLPTLLIADDNDDFREFLVGELQDNYNILQARNGRQALKMAQENYVDVVLSDVMMPQMDGNELCRQLKHDEQTSHIFIVLLTAKTAEESMLEGYNAGADFYLTKPFSLELLRSRLQYLATLRQRRIELLAKIPLSATGGEHNGLSTRLETGRSPLGGSTGDLEDDLKLSPIDRRFMERLHQLTQQHLSDPEFSVDNFAEDMAMSRRAFYRKMNALTGMTPNKYLNEQRLQTADRLLHEGKLNVSEVADRVGFADPNYFSRAYKARFGITPKEVRGA